MPESQEIGNLKKTDELEDDPEYKPPVIYNVNSNGHGIHNSSVNLDGNCRTRPKRKITKPKTYEEFFHDFTGVSNLYFETDKFGTDLVFNYNQTHHVYRNKNRKSANGAGNSVDSGVCNTKSNRNVVVNNSIDTKGIDIKSDDDTACGIGVTVNNRIMNFLNGRKDVAVGTDISEAKKTESSSNRDKEVCIGKNRVNTSIDRSAGKQPSFVNIICDDEELKQIEFRNDDEEKEKSCDRLMEGFRTFLKLNAFNCFVDEVEKIPFFCFETEDGLNDYTEYSKNCIGANVLSKPRNIRKSNSPVAACYSTDRNKGAGTAMCSKIKKEVAGGSSFLVKQEEAHRHRQAEIQQCFKEQAGEEEEEEEDDDEMDCLQVRLNSEAGLGATGGASVKFYFKKGRDDLESSSDENSLSIEQRRRATADDRKANDSTELSDNGDEETSPRVKIEPSCSYDIAETRTDLDCLEVGRRKRRSDNPFRRRTYEINFDELNSMLKLRAPKTLFYLILYLGVGRPLYPVVYENLILAKTLYNKEDNEVGTVAEHDTTITKLWANFATSVLVIEKPDITAVRKIAFPVVHCKLSEPYCQIENGRLYAIDYSSEEESQLDAIDGAAVSSAEKKRRGRPKKRSVASRQHQQPDHPVVIKKECVSEPISASAVVEKSPVPLSSAVKNEKNSSPMFLRSFVGSVANDEKSKIPENPSISDATESITTNGGQNLVGGGTSFDCSVYCSRTYGQRLNYLHRNSDEMYKYKLNAIFEKQRKNIQFFGVCEYVQVRKEESSSQQQQLQNNDNGNECGSNEAKLRFRSPSSDYNMRMAAIKHYFERIFSINKETGARHHISDVPSPLKFPSTVRWLLFRVETCFTSIVFDVREAIYHSEFLEILYKAELTKAVHRYRTVSFQSKYCRDNKREFGAYAFPGLCKLILLGPYNENERHRLSAVLKVDGRKPSTIPFKTFHFNERHFLFTKQKGNKQEIDFTWWTPFVQRSDATVNELHLNSFFRLTDCVYNYDLINEEVTSSELEQTCKVGKNLKRDLDEHKADVVTTIHDDIVDYGKKSKTEFSETLQRNLSFTDVVSPHKNTKNCDWLLKRRNNNVNCSKYFNPKCENGNAETSQVKEIFQRKEDKFLIQECCNDAEVNDSKDELTSKKKVNTPKKERSRKRKYKESPVEADLDDNEVTEHDEGKRTVGEYSSDNTSASSGQKQPTENVEDEKSDEIFPSFKIFEGVNEQDREEPTTVELYIVESGNDMAFDFEAEQDYQDDPLKIESVEDEANGTDSIESSSLLLYEDNLKNTKSVDSEILPDSGSKTVYPLDDVLNVEISTKKSSDPSLNIKKERRPYSRNLYKLRQSQVYRKDLSKRVAKLGSLVSNEKVPNYVTKDVLHASRKKCIQLREEENILMSQKLQSINSLLSLHSRLRSLLNGKIVNKKALDYQKAKEIYGQLDIEWSHDEYSITVAEDGVLAKMMRTVPVNKDIATMATPAPIPIPKSSSLPVNVSNAVNSEVISVSSDDDTDYSFTDTEMLSNGTMPSVGSVTSETNSMDYCTPSNDGVRETESCITADSGGRLKRKRQSSKRLKDYIDVPDYIQDKEILDNTKKSIPSKKSTCSVAVDVGECPVTIIGPEKHKKKQKPSFVSHKSLSLPRRKSSTPTKSDSFLKRSSTSAILDLNLLNDGTRKLSSFALNNNRENVQDNKNGFYSSDNPMRTNNSLIIDASDMNGGPRWNTVLEDHSYCFQYERLPGTTGNRLKKGFRSLCNGTIGCVNGTSTIKPRLEMNALTANAGQSSRGELTSGTINSAAKKRNSCSAEATGQQKKSNNNLPDTAVKSVSHPVVMTTFPFNKNSQIQLLKHQKSTDSAEHIRRNFTLDSIQLQQQKVKCANKLTVDITSDGSSSKPANVVHQRKNLNKNPDDVIDVDHRFKKNCTETQSSSCNNLKANNSLIPEALYRRRGRPSGTSLQNTYGSTASITSKSNLPQSTSKLLPALVNTSVDRRSHFIAADTGAIALANRTTQLKDILPPTLKTTAAITSTSTSIAEDSAKGAKQNLSLQDEVTSPLEAFYKKVNFK